MTQQKSTISSSEYSQAHKFTALARELKANGDEARWDERLTKLAKHKPATEKPAERG